MGKLSEVSKDRGRQEPAFFERAAKEAIMKKCGPALTAKEGSKLGKEECFAVYDGLAKTSNMLNEKSIEVGWVGGLHVDSARSSIRNQRKNLKRVTPDLQSLDTSNMKDTNQKHNRFELGYDMLNYSLN